MNKLRNITMAIFSNKMKILVLLLFASSVFLFSLLLIILFMTSILESMSVMMAIALVLSLLATWQLYIAIKNPHLKNTEIISAVFIVAGGFTIGVLGTFLSGYLNMSFWLTNLGPLPALFLSTVPCLVMGSLLGHISWCNVFEYGERHVSMLYVYIMLGAILMGMIGFLTAVYIDSGYTISAFNVTPTILFTIPCGMILGIYAGWRLWRFRYFKRIN